MAEGKKTVLLYCDLIHTVEKLTDIQAGKLFKHYLRYVNDLSPEADDTLIDIVFEPIKQSLKRDLRKWQIFIEKQRQNGQMGGRPKTQKTQAFISKPKKAVKVKVTVKDKVKDKDIINVSRRFTTPDTHDIKDYFFEKTQSKKIANFEGEKFFDFYSSKNWMVGKNKMKDWRAAVRNWLRRLSEVEESKPKAIIPMDTSGKTPEEVQQEIEQMKVAYKNQRV